MDESHKHREYLNDGSATGDQVRMQVIFSLNDFLSLLIKLVTTSNMILPYSVWQQQVQKPRKPNLQESEKSVQQPPAQPTTHMPDQHQTTLETPQQPQQVHLQSRKQQSQHNPSQPTNPLVQQPTGLFHQSSIDLSVHVPTCSPVHHPSTDQSIQTPATNSSVHVTGESTDIMVKSASTTPGCSLDGNLGINVSNEAVSSFSPKPADASAANALSVSASNFT
jgi:hypothetical protein